MLRSAGRVIQRLALATPAFFMFGHARTAADTVPVPPGPLHKPLELTRYEKSDLVASFAP